MPSAHTLQRFIAMVEQNQHADAAEQFYAPDAVIRENQGPPREGRDAQVALERGVMARAVAIQSKCVAPVLVNGDHVVVRWVFDFEWPDGTFTHMEELAWQRWDGELIAEETFFYDPAQRTPQRRPA